MEIIQEVKVDFTRFSVIFFFKIFLKLLSE